MPFDVSGYNVVQQTSQKTPEQVRQEAEIRAKEAKLKQLGISQEQYDYLKSRGISEARFASLQSQGLSKEAILLIAAQKSPERPISQTAVNSLNRLAKGGHLFFRAGVFDADMRRYESYSNEKALQALVKILNIHDSKNEGVIGKYQTIRIGPEGISLGGQTTEPLLRYAPGEKGAEQALIDARLGEIQQRQEIMKQMEILELANPNYGASYNPKTNEIEVSLLPKYTITNAESGKSGEVFFTMGSGEKVEYANLPQVKETIEQANAIVGELEKQANEQAANYYGVSGRYYEYSEGRLKESNLAEMITSRPEDFGLARTTVFEETGGKTLTNKAWFSYKYPTIASNAEMLGNAQKNFYKAQGFAQTGPWVVKNEAKYGERGWYESFAADYDRRYEEMIKGGENLFSRMESNKAIPFLWSPKAYDEFIKSVNPQDYPGAYILLGGKGEQIYVGRTAMEYKEMGQHKGGLVGIYRTTQEKAESPKGMIRFLFGVQNVGSDLLSGFAKAGVGTVYGATTLAEGIYEAEPLNMNKEREIKTDKIQLAPSKILEGFRGLAEPALFIAQFRFLTAASALKIGGASVGRYALPLIAGYGIGMEQARSGSPEQAFGYGVGIVATWKEMERAAEAGYGYFRNKYGLSGLSEMARNVFIDERFVDINKFKSAPKEVREAAIRSTDEFFRKAPESVIDEKMGVRTQKLKLTDDFVLNKEVLDWSNFRVRIGGKEYKPFKAFEPKDIIKGIKYEGYEKPLKGWQERFDVAMKSKGLSWDYDLGGPRFPDVDIRPPGMFGKEQMPTGSGGMPKSVHELNPELKAISNYRIKLMGKEYQPLQFLSDLNFGKPIQFASTFNPKAQSLSTELTLFGRYKLWDYSFFGARPEVIEQPKPSIQPKRAIATEATEPASPKIKPKKILATKYLVQKPGLKAGLPLLRQGAIQKIAAPSRQRFDLANMFRTRTTQRMKVETAQKLKSEVAQRLRVEAAQRLRVEAPQMVRTNTVQKLKMEQAQKLRVEVAQKLRVEVAQKLRVEVAQRLRVGVAKAAKSGIIQDLSNPKIGIKLGLGKAKKKYAGVKSVRGAWASFQSIFESEARYGRALNPSFEESVRLEREYGIGNVPAARIRGARL